MPKHSSVSVDLARLKVACQNCSLFQLCLPVGLGQGDLELLDRIIKRHRPVHRGEHLFRAGDPFQAIYAVRSGSVKTYAVSEDGGEQVTGFHLSGELFGMDAISSGTHCCSAMVLERSSVCEIPFDRLEELGARIPSLMRQTVRIMSKEILRDKRIMQITKNSAPGRLAAFLLGLSERFHERGFAAQEYHLSMSRIDIGNYLGLADETVSRLFTRFQEDGLLAVERKRIRLIDTPRLQAVARGLTERAPLKIYIGGGMYSKPHTGQDAPERKGHTGFPSWDPIYRIGVDVIDRQHQKLFDISNRFYDAWRHHERRAVLCRIFDELIEYTGYHFAEEERLMQQIDYPALPQHRANHEELVELVNHYRTQLKGRTAGAERQVIEFVRTWLRAHVLDADRKIGVYLAGKKRFKAGQR
ncbi:MAG: fumarate/nitrate reduction transcriptional regulator Fnr [Pseudomonadota bacterium]